MNKNFYLIYTRNLYKMLGLSDKVDFTPVIELHNLPVRGKVIHIYTKVFTSGLCRPSFVHIWSEALV